MFFFFYFWFYLNYFLLFLFLILLILLLYFNYFWFLYFYPNFNWFFIRARLMTKFYLFCNLMYDFSLKVSRSIKNYLVFYLLKYFSVILFHIFHLILSMGFIYRRLLHINLWYFVIFFLLLSFFLLILVKIIKILLIFNTFTKSYSWIILKLFSGYYLSVFFYPFY